MAFPVGARTTGELVTAAIWNADLKDNLNTLRAGGVAIASQAALDFIYASSASQLARLAKGSAYQYPRMNSAASGYEFTSLVVVATAITATGTQNDLSVPAGRFVVVPFNNASDSTVTGFAPASAPQDGDILEVYSKGAGNLYFKNEGVGSTAAYRLLNYITSGLTPLAAGCGTARFVYDGTAARFRLVSHEQGAWISFTPTQSVDSGGGSITSPTQTGYYRVQGRTLTANIQIAGTPTATVNTIRVALPDTFTTRQPGSNPGDVTGYGANGALASDNSRWKVGAANGTYWLAVLVANDGAEVSYNTGTAYTVTCGNALAELN